MSRRISHSHFSGAIGTDTGGTFTDFVWLDAGGELRVAKRPSTPDDPSRSLLQGLQEAGQGWDALDSDLTHGTTVATNALLERRGAKTALITTHGFADVLEIGRQTRPDLYAPHPHLPPPLLAVAQRFAVRERLDNRGQIVTPLDEGEVRDLLDCLIGQGIESLAVCLLFAYLNPLHEQRIGTLAQERGLSVSLSSEVAPQPREWERTGTTVANAFVAPLLTAYLNTLQAGLTALAARTTSDGESGEAAVVPLSVGQAAATRLYVMASNGGALTPAQAGREAVKTVLSGPAGGIVAAQHLGRMLNRSHLLTFDMGGTSTDVAFLADGKCAVVEQTLLDGLPLQTPQLAIHTIGAGGGSLVQISRAGALRVGPESAGASPGPVAYGKGERLTVTDAQVLLGRLPAGVRLAGQIALDGERVRNHFDRLGREMGLSPERAALGILEVAEAAMARALRHVSVEQGHDPADCTLLGYGGAGGLHVCRLAERLGCHEIAIPRYPGAFSALGLALAEVTCETDFALAAPFLFAKDNKNISNLWHKVEECTVRAKNKTVQETTFTSPGTTAFQVLLAVRYVGQSSTLSILLDALPEGGQSAFDVAARFHRQHRERYGYADPTAPVEVVAVRVRTIRSRPMPPWAAAVHAHTHEPKPRVRVYEGGTWEEASLYGRSGLTGGDTLSGPAVVVQEDATLYIAPGWSGTTHSSGTLLLTNRQITDQNEQLMPERGQSESQQATQGAVHDGNHLD